LSLEFREGLERCRKACSSNLDPENQNPLFVSAPVTTLAPTITLPPAPRLFLVDGYALIYRAFFALIARPLTTSRGENTSAAWGIVNFLNRLLERHRPEYLGWAHDSGLSFRHKTYAEYKAFGNVQFPTKIKQTAGGHPSVDLTISDVQANTTVDLPVPATVQQAPFDETNTSIGTVTSRAIHSRCDGRVPHTRDAGIRQCRQCRRQ
jgi:hypothetical protein